MLKRIIFLVLFFSIHITEAQVLPASSDLQEDYLRGTVQTINTTTETNAGGNEVTTRIITIKLDHPFAGQSDIAVKERTDINIVNQLHVNKNDRVVVLRTENDGSIDYVITDYNRLPMLLLIAGVFLFFVLLLSRWKGLLSLIALGLSLFVLIKFIAPAILHGSNPAIVSLIGACGLILPIFYLGHGWNKKTTLAAIATGISIMIATGIAYIFVAMTRLAGLGSEEAAFLQLATDQSVNLRGLLLGGMIIGALGVLDDITIAQTTAIAELKEVNPLLSAWDLYRRGLKLGREHISSLVNTLALAYVGASFPLFLLFTLNAEQPMWAIINSEIMAEEIVRALVGSTALVLAVPIASVLAAYVFGKSKKPIKSETPQNT